ncbi:TonB-dependent receptor [Paraflavitalea sp. CAU 1676]|uniref:SusC/RagA family TonB-linked outer membrane protein n=1 Tax=Paraflavitalea sp. CAU 1676 TaxID=3032598 RepID=UPI0023DA1645|nr:TonB-dependent receptor [Paraflavitalea sp. CAU 1676]MDF2187184.1 TonB-dependent receptor [Paraflavitalea sp. CAU 1676]
MSKQITVLLFVLCTWCLASYAQTSIRGVVTDNTSKSPMAGATVLVKGSKTATITGNDGRYEITLPPKATTLVFQFTGYHSKEVAISGRSEINIELETDFESLNEVMVVAYGNAKKGTYTGAASVIKQNDIKDVPSTSFQNALVGRVSGVQVTTASGQAGTTPSIRIRGIGSMNASNEPLYVIDGVPVISGDQGNLSGSLIGSNNIMNTLNPADIETITILKDAAASSLYGSRAANGVVVITTKRGKKGKPVVHLSSSIGVTPGWATDNYEVGGPQEQINMLYRILYDNKTSAGQTAAQANTYALGQLNTKFNKHGYKFSTTGTALSDNVIISGMTDGLVNREGTYFDWDDAYFGTGIYQTNDLSVGGGDQNTTYYTSLNYTKDQNRVRVNKFDRISGRTNISQKVGKHLEFTTNIGLARNKQSGFNDTRNTGANYLYQVRNLLWPFYWPTDYKTGLPYTARYGSLAQNNLYYNDQWENSSITKRFSVNETILLTILPELNVKSIFSYDNSEIKDHLYYSAIHYNGVSTNGSLNETSTSISKLVSSNTVNYAKNFGDHNVSFLGGFEVEENRTNFQSTTGTNLPSSVLTTLSPAGAFSASGYEYGNSIVSLLSRLEYNYKQKYFLSGSFRRDGSSKLAPDTRWGNFWSVAGSWRISNEEFMKEITPISNLRLRASYGINGTLPSQNYGWRSLTSYTLRYNGNAGGYLSTNANPDLTWETNYTTNIGLEFGLFKQRLTGTIEYFNRDSRNLLQDVPTSTTTGFSSALANVGEINNKGIEVELGGDIINNKSIRWSASVNASFIKSKVTKLYGGRDIIWYDPTGGDNRAQFIYREGSSTLSYYGYEWGGVDPKNGNNVWYVNNPADAKAGDFLYNDRGATYSFNKANYKIVGDAMPDVYGGLNTSLEYKGVTLGLNFIYKLGGKLYDGAFKDVSDDGYYWERIRTETLYANMWTPENTSGNLPLLRGTDLTDPMQYSTRQMSSATFFRLKNVNLSYDLPRNLIGKVGLSNVRVFFNGSNLLTFSKYKIADPEVNQYGTRGWETPIGKTYTFGLDLNF